MRPPRLVGLPKAAEILYTGDFIEAEEALHLGMLNRLVPSQKLAEEGMALALKIAANAPIAIRLTKMLLYEGLQMDFRSTLNMIAACETITLTSSDRYEGVKAYLEKRPARFEGK